MMNWIEKSGMHRTPAPHVPGTVYAEIKPSVVHEGQFVARVYRRHCKHGAIGIHKAMNTDREALKRLCEKIIKQESKQA